MLKTNIDITFKDGEKLRVKNVTYVLTDIEKLFGYDKENVMVIRFCDDVKGEGSVMVEKAEVKYIHVELEDIPENVLC